MRNDINLEIAKTGSFTGHRPERLRFPESKVIPWLEREIRQAIDEGYTTFISGMQRGVDLWAAEIVIKIRNEGVDIRLIAASAFRGMESQWDHAWKKRYKSVFKDADETVFVSDTPGRAAFFKRNHYMVDRSSLLIAVYSGGGGGTKETIRYAEEKDIEVRKYVAR